METMIFSLLILLLSVSLSPWDFTYNEITAFPLKLNWLLRLLWKISVVSAGICTEHIPRCYFGEIGAPVKSISTCQTHSSSFEVWRIWILLHTNSESPFFPHFNVLSFWMCSQSCCFAMSPSKPQHDWKHSVKASPFHSISLALYSHL